MRPRVWAALIGLAATVPFASTGFTLLNPGAENAVADLFLHDAEGVLLACPKGPAAGLAAQRLHP